MKHAWSAAELKSESVTCSVMSDSLQPPWIIACQAFLSIECSRQEYWSRLPFPPPGDFPNPGIEPRSSLLQADSVPSEPPGKPCFSCSWFLISYPHQCFCLENPRDKGAWWAAIYGVSQSWTRLKWLSSSSVGYTKERQCQRMLKLPHNCTHLTHYQNNAQNSPSQQQ